jgi:hypothetical protein
LKRKSENFPEKNSKIASLKLQHPIPYYIINFKSSVGQFNLSFPAIKFYGLVDIESLVKTIFILQWKTSTRKFPFPEKIQRKTHQRFRTKAMYPKANKKLQQSHKLFFTETIKMSLFRIYLKNVD